MSREAVVPTPGRLVTDYLAEQVLSRNSVRTPMRKLHVKFGELAVRKRLKLLEASGHVRLSGRGRNRAVILTAAGIEARHNPTWEDT